VSGLALRRQLEEQGLLSQFSEDAISWAEQVGIRWIDLEGEPWTLVFHLEEKKGVDKGDFTRNAKLAKPGSRALPEKKVSLSEATQRLLKTQGVRNAKIPTAFSVEGGVALSCAGAGSRDDILSILRSQWAGWPVACSQFLLVNLPLALAYLQHGRSSVAKATRDLTIGTTMNVAKAAAKQETAPMAVQQLAGIRNPELVAALQALIALGQDQQRVEAKADRSLERSEEAHQRIDRLELKSIQPTPKQKRANASKATIELLHHVRKTHYGNLCPCCREPIREKDLELDHWLSKSSSDPADVWFVCGPCNVAMGAPVGDGGRKRTSEQEARFRTFQDLVQMHMKASKGIQLRLGLDAA
jgi:hypothetical protein